MVKYIKKFRELKTVIVLEKDSKLEAWGSLTNACIAHKEFQYYSIKMKKFPFEHKGYVFYNLPYNKKRKENNKKS